MADNFFSRIFSANGPGGLAKIFQPLQEETTTANAGGLMASVADGAKKFRDADTKVQAAKGSAAVFATATRVNQSPEVLGLPASSVVSGPGEASAQFTSPDPSLASEVTANLRKTNV